MLKRLFAAMLAALFVAGCAVGEDGKTEAKGDMSMMTGQCHCGRIKYEAKSPIVKCSYCDCRGCQRATGTLKAPFVTVRRDGVKVISGKPSEFRAASGEKCDAHGVWLFCPDCGTQLFWKGDKGDELDIFAGTLDDASVFKPKE